MVIYDVEQGSDRWRTVRAGIPTASNFHKIHTPTGKESQSETVEQYMFDLLAERVLGRPLVERSSIWMERGSYLEAEAIAFYHFTRDCETREIGFVTTDDKRIGASPDRVVGDDGLLEVKCPKAGTHLGYALSDLGFDVRRGGVDAKYYAQLQGQLWICERKWVDIQSYHPEMQPATVRVARDEKYIETLSRAVRNFSDHLEDMAAKLDASGWLKPILFERAS